MTIAAITGIVVLTVFLLVTERIPVDLTALGVMVLLALSGILSPQQAVAGLAHPAPITVGALFVVSAALERTGALGFLASRLGASTEGRPRLLLLLSLALCAPLSAFVNNTPVVVLMISVLLSACDHQTLSPSKFLIPVSFISILAGTATLIGTSTNIIVSDLSVQLGQVPITMFELTPLGLPLTLLGGTFLFFFSFRLLPNHRTPVLKTEAATQRQYLSELQIPQGSPLIGCDAVTGPCQTFPQLEVFEVIRGITVHSAKSESLTLRAGDILLARASAETLVRILDDGTALLPVSREGTTQKPFDEKSVIVELIVAPSSRLIGRSWSESSLSREPHIHCIGVQRQWVHYSRKKLEHLRLEVGDILLVQSPMDHLDQLRAGGDVIVVEDLHPALVNRRKAPLAVGIFLAMIAAATSGLVDIMVAALTAAVLLIASGCLSLKAAYRALDPRTLLLIIGTLALGKALEVSGAAQLYAQLYLNLLSGAPPWAILGGFILLTSLLSHFLSNNSTAVLMAPIALSAAAGLGVSARPFVIGLCFGASACFASPIGYQTNLLVYGPGGYRFVDYIRVGLPLDLLVCLGATVAVPWLWPF